MVAGCATLCRYLMKFSTRSVIRPLFGTWAVADFGGFEPGLPDRRSANARILSCLRRELGYAEIIIQSDLAVGNRRAGFKTVGDSSFLRDGF